MKANIDVKTIAGIGAGVALGHFAFKSKNPLVLMAFGIGGGLIAHQALKTRDSKISEAEKTAELYMEEAKQDIEATIAEVEAGKEIPQAQNSSAEGVSFNPTVGYITPYGQVEEQNPKEYLDLSF